MGVFFTFFFFKKLSLNVLRYLVLSGRCKSKSNSITAKLMLYDVYVLAFLLMFYEPMD